MRFSKPNLRSVAILTVLLAFGSLVSAQTPDLSRPDLSGTWNFDHAKPLSGTGGEMKSTKGIEIFDQLTIEPSGIELRVKQHFYMDFRKTDGSSGRVGESNCSTTLFTDGRGEDNTCDGKTDFSVTAWEGDRLITTFLSEPDKKGKRRKTGTTKMELDKKGRLVVTVERAARPITDRYAGSVPILFDRHNRKAVFNKAP